MSSVNVRVTLRRLLFASLLSIVVVVLASSASEAATFQSIQLGPAPASVVLAAHHYDTKHESSSASRSSVDLGVTASSGASSVATAGWESTPSVSKLIAADATGAAAEEARAADTYVIGRTADVDPFRGAPGYQTFELNCQPYTWEANESWLRTALANGNPIKIVSDLSPENMASARFGISAFGRELRLLWNEGLSPDPFAEVGQTLQTSPAAP